jgi:hypothetical protein
MDCTGTTLRSDTRLHKSVQIPSEIALQIIRTITSIYKPSLVTSRWLAQFNKDQYHRRIAVKVQIGHGSFLEYVSQDVLEVECKKWAVGCW